MNNLCADIGYKSLNKYQEQLCGDNVEYVEDEEHNTSTFVLADGLGSGVKACILSTLTSKILSTMMEAGLNINDSVSTIAATLPVCKERGVAYSTFTIFRLIRNSYVELIQYDNPKVIMLRDGKNYDYPTTLTVIGGKSIYTSTLDVKENDVFFLLSDGCVHAGVGMKLNLGWQRENIIEFLESLYDIGFTAKTLCTILLDECNRLYDNMPGDDTTVCAIRIRERKQVNLLIGPPSQREDCNKMMNLFFSKEGKHIVCGGTTSTIASQFLKRPLVPNLDFSDPEIPPTATIEGVDLVTEGVITINKVLKYAEDYLKSNESYTQWSYKQDGASKIARMLFEDATDINFYVGRAINPAHQNPSLPINFSIKMNLVNQLADCLKKMGKRIKVSYF